MISKDKKPRAAKVMMTNMNLDQTTTKKLFKKLITKMKAMRTISFEEQHKFQLSKSR